MYFLGSKKIKFKYFLLNLEILFLRKNGCLLLPTGLENCFVFTNSWDAGIKNTGCHIREY
jgi:hypothetical protein